MEGLDVPLLYVKLSDGVTFRHLIRFLQAAWILHSLSRRLSLFIVYDRPLLSGQP